MSNTAPHSNITEQRRASIHDVRSLFKELESQDPFPFTSLGFMKSILTRTEKTDLLKKVEEFEQRQRTVRESKFERRKGISPALPRCKTCKVFLWFLAIIFLGSFELSVASLYSLFYVTR